MANKRMFAKTIIDSDAFLDMPLSSQALYFHLSMRADDDGFVNNPKKISRMVNCSDDDLKLLVAKRFLLYFESGVVVIKHWLIHNTIRKDRKTPTNYQNEYHQLELKQNGSYTKVSDNKALEGVATTWKPVDNHMTTNWQPTDGQAPANCQHSIVECSVVETSILETSVVDSEENSGGGGANDELGKISDFYQQNIGVLAPNTLESLLDNYKLFGYDMVIHALTITVDQQANYGYTKGIFDRWLRENIKTMDDVRAQSEAFKRKNKSKYKKNSNHQEIIPYWMKEKEAGIKQQDESAVDTSSEEYDEEEMRRRINELIENE